MYKVHRIFGHPRREDLTYKAPSNNLLQVDRKGPGRVHNVYNLKIVPFVHLLNGSTLLQGKAVRLD